MNNMRGKKCNIFLNRILFFHILLYITCPSNSNNFHHLVKTFNVYEPFSEWHLKLLHLTIRISVHGIETVTKGEKLKQSS